MKRYALAIWLVSGLLAVPQSPTIKIRIGDPPRISAEILRKAEKEAGALLESGGIKVIWRDCPKASACEHQLAADELILSLLARKTNQEGTQHYALGGASTDSAGTGVYGWVNYDLVQVVATREGVAPELLLAFAITHEIGHLLGLAHEPLGLMQGYWGSPQLKAHLCFNRKQRERLQTEVLARMWSHQEAMQNRNGPSTTSKTDIPTRRIEASD